MSPEIQELIERPVYDDDGFKPMPESDRIRLAVEQRKEIEYNLTQAKLLEELRNKHLARADDLIMELTGKLTEKQPRIQKGYSRMTEEEKTKVISAFADGESATAIAKREGRSVVTITTLLRREGLADAPVRGIRRKVGSPHYQQNERLRRL